jgi:hypothetical protein
MVSHTHFTGTVYTVYTFKILKHDFSFKLTLIISNALWLNMLWFFYQERSGCWQVQVSVLKGQTYGDAFSLFVANW